MGRINRKANASFQLSSAILSLPNSIAGRMQKMRVAYSGSVQDTVGLSSQTARKLQSGNGPGCVFSLWAYARPDRQPNALVSGQKSGARRESLHIGSDDCFGHTAPQVYEWNPLVCTLYNAPQRTKPNSFKRLYGIRMDPEVMTWQLLEFKAQV